MTISWYIPSQQVVPLENTPAIKNNEQKFNVTFQITAVKQPLADTSLVQGPGQPLDPAKLERPAN